MACLMIVDDFWKRENEFGGRFIDIGIGNAAVAAARMIERLPRCSNKAGQKRRCL